MTLDHFVPALQLSIAPVIVISGAGLVLLSMTNRFARVIDRSREMARLLQNDERRSKVYQIQCQLDILVRRGRLLRLAIELTSVTLLLAAALVIALFLAVLYDLEATLAIALLFVCCMVSLMAGLIFFIVDVKLSLSALRLEIGDGIKSQAHH